VREDVYLLSYNSQNGVDCPGLTLIAVQPRGSKLTVSRLTGFEYRFKTLLIAELAFSRISSLQLNGSATAPKCN